MPNARHYRAGPRLPGWPAPAAADLKESRQRGMITDSRLESVRRLLPTHHERNGERTLAADAKIHIVGIGDDGPHGLSAAARTLIEQAELVVGSSASLAATAGAQQRFVLTPDLEALVRTISAHPDRRTVVLAGGDPLFYGVARFLCDQLGKDRFEVVPHVSSMQLAFARVKESWDEAYLADLSHVQLDRAVEKIRTTEKAGLFTTDTHSPAAIAKTLLARRIDYFQVYVCENLGSPDERVTQGDLGEIAGLTFSPLNVMILVRRPGAPDRPVEQAGMRLFGNPDETFQQSKPHRGLITPAEVRVIALAELDLGPRSVVWDVGAGSGAVAIEAARIAHEGTVYAIEMDTEEHRLILANTERFGVSNLIPVLGAAPDAWSNLPAPDAIFVGGTGRAVTDLCKLALPRLKTGGRLVANVNSLDNLTVVHSLFRQQAGSTSVRMLNIARSTDQLDTVRFHALNPTFLIGFVKA